MFLNIDEELRGKFFYSCLPEQAITFYLYVDKDLNLVSNHIWVSNNLTDAEAHAASDELISALDMKEEPYPEFQRQILRYSDFDELDGSREEIVAKISRRQLGNLDRNIEKLFDHFSITAGKPWSWQVLAIALANKHIPEFSALELRNSLPQGGARVKWMRLHRVILFAYVQFRKSEKPSLSLESVLRAMPKNLRKTLHDAANGTLRREYYKAEKDEKVLQYCQECESSFGPDWIQQWLDENSLEVDVNSHAIGGVPRLRRRKAQPCSKTS